MDAQATMSVAIRDDYRRRARRLRAMYSNDAMRLHRALRQLAATQIQRVITTPDKSAAQRFADHVRDSMDGPILRYSVRRRLLREADARGIGRFEANLIIAAVQHKVDCVPVRAVSRPSKSAWVCFALLQTAIVMLAWIAIT
jgi:hypothetical protein